MMSSILFTRKLRHREVNNLAMDTSKGQKPAKGRNIIWTQAVYPQGQELDKILEGEMLKKKQRSVKPQWSMCVSGCVYVHLHDYVHASLVCMTCKWLSDYMCGYTNVLDCVCVHAHTVLGREKEIYILGHILHSVCIGACSFWLQKFCLFVFLRTPLLFLKQDPHWQLTEWWKSLHWQSGTCLLRLHKKNYNTHLNLSY